MFLSVVLFLQISFSLQSSLSSVFSFCLAAPTPLNRAAGSRYIDGNAPDRLQKSPRHVVTWLWSGSPEADQFEVLIKAPVT